MNNKSLIIWEKWIDPFGQDADISKWIDYDDDQNDDDSDSLIKEQIIQNIANKPIKVIASPLGLIPYNEYTASSKIFNFWLGHTNFNISQKIQDIIEQCDGVEVLDTFTRYRFRIAIGKCFNDSEVMTAINDKIYSFLN